MTQPLRIYYKSFVEQLRKVYDEPEAESIAGIVFEEILMMKKHHIFMLEKELFETEIEQLNNILNKLLKHEPVQYVLGIADFFGLRFRVNKSVLIPRRETEELVELIVKDVRNHTVHPVEKETAINILDIGTGSGCIAIALKKNLPVSKVTGIDLSNEALEVAKENTFLNKTNVEFLLADILNPTFHIHHITFDIIVSNPPYITHSEKGKMLANVLDYEPHAALFVTGDDPLQFYNAIADFAASHLNRNGKLYFEINENFGTEVKKMLEAKGFIDVHIVRDMQGKDRMISCAFEK